MTEELRDQIEELVMMQRVDQELGATLDFENVLMLTMDWALRRTGALAGMYITLTPDGSGLLPLVTLGYPSGSIPEDSPWPADFGVLGRAVRTRQPQVVNDVTHDRDYIALLPSTRSVIAVPIEVRDVVLGVLSLESDKPDSFLDADIAFVQRLAGRTAIALDHARLYRQAAAQADDMGRLYSSSRLISSSLERAEVLTNAAQSIASVMSVSSAILFDLRRDRGQIVVARAYHYPTARNSPDVLPAVEDSFDLDWLPEFQEAIMTQQAVVVRTADPKLSASVRSMLEERHYRSALILPLNVSGEGGQLQCIGLAAAVESRRDRRFTEDELEMGEALASQIASALRQAQLYEDVRELENLKSEMIRMASHDLRNPLGNVMGYFDLFVTTLRTQLKPEHHEYIGHIKRSLATMKALIEDLLTLERVESERQSLWVDVDFAVLVREVVEAQRSASKLKNHTMTLLGDDRVLKIYGSQTQLRQAITNLVSNAIKYTPDNGLIQVRLSQKEKRLIFEVQDNGYGIAKDRQLRLFTRFYRALQPGTDHISGTGLGLSLVKTVAERHGGEVWVHSEPEIGSTFGMWLPLSEMGDERQEPTD